ncbi:MAG: hypothetical protein V1787_02775 [Candidatus Micrarchaeota archaeon]
MARGLFTSDFVLSLAIFMIVLALAAPLWDHVRAQAAYSSVQYRIQADALAASDALVRSPGNPRDWDAASVMSMGLADEEHMLNGTKVSMMFNMLKADYPAAKGRMGLAPYDLNISITDGNGQTIDLQGNETGFASDAPVSVAAFNVRRIALLEANSTHRQIVNINLVVWR